MKKINLLPVEYKNKLFNRHIFLSIIAVFTLIIIVLFTMLANMVILNMSINNLKKENSEYNITKTKIADLEKQMTDNQSFLNEQNKDFFDFYYFMTCISKHKPYGLDIISIDSFDRITKNEDAIGNNAVYEKDLSGTKIILRGMAQNAQEISTYVYNLSEEPFVKNIVLSGIEEKTFDTTYKTIVFESIMEVN